MPAPLPPLFRSTGGFFPGLLPGGEGTVPKQAFALVGFFNGAEEGLRQDPLEVGFVPLMVAVFVRGDPEGELPFRETAMSGRGRRNARRSTAPHRVQPRAGGTLCRLSSSIGLSGHEDSWGGGEAAVTSTGDPVAGYAFLREGLDAGPVLQEGVGRPVSC